MGEFDKTDFLMSKANFLAGMGSCLDLGGNFFHYNISRSAAAADTNAIYMDWRMVGNDLRQAMDASPPNDDHSLAAVN